MLYNNSYEVIDLHNCKKSVKFTLITVYVAMAAMFLLAVTLPWIITWYVEIKGKDAGLPAVVMITFYPCVLPVFVALFSLKNLLKNILGGLVFGDKNIHHLKVMALCCILCAAITLVAGFYYLPFFFVSVASLGCAVFVKAMKDVFAVQLESQRDELYKSVREEL